MNYADMTREQLIDALEAVGAGGVSGQRITQPSEPVKVRPETLSEHIARDMREGRFPGKSERKMVPAEPVKVPTKWSGWACQYPGKMPRLYGDKSIAMLNHHPEEGDRLLYLVEQSNPIPEPVKGPSDDELLDQALRERDAASEMADKLADAIAKHLGVEIGEHSSANHPWYRALDAIEASQPVEPVKVPSDAEIREVLIENGFTIKPGHDDLKPYVYKAARDLLARYGAQP